MFSLIITIISIALVVALAVATIYYGGDAFTSGNAKAKAATIINESIQIEGAIKLFQTEHAGTSPTSLQQLKDEQYLKGIPGNTDWEFRDDQIVAVNIDEQTCRLANAQVGISGIPFCADVTDNRTTVCCQE